MLAAQIGDRNAGLVLLQNPDDLLFRKAIALHALILVAGQSELQSGLSRWGKVTSETPKNFVCITCRKNGNRRLFDITPCANSRIVDQDVDLAGFIHELPGVRCSTLMNTSRGNSLRFSPASMAGAAEQFPLLQTTARSARSYSEIFFR